MRLHSSGQGGVSSILEAGHTFISLHKKELSNNYWHTTNTFGFWGNDQDNDSSNTYGRTNNMRNVKNNGSWSNLVVDDGKNVTDWRVGISHPADAGGEFWGYRRVTRTISKQAYEEIKFMNGYKVDNYQNKNWLPFPFCQMCSTYAARLWNPYTDDIEDFGTCLAPGDIYNILN